MTQDRNKNRPGYKKTKVGWIPEKWKVARLGEFATFRNGLNFLSGDTGFSYQMIGVSGFQDFLSPKPCSYERVSVASELREDDLLRTEDLLFVRSNGNKSLIGRCLFIAKLEHPTTFSGFTIRCRLNKRTQVWPLFIALFARSQRTRYQLWLAGGGTNISNLSQSILANIKLPSPPLPEQQKIAAILSTWDNAIEQTRKLIAAKKRRKKGLMQQLLTGKMRLPQFRTRDNPETHQTHEAEVPDGWRQVKLGDVFIERRETGFPDLPLLAVTGNRGIIPAEEVDRKDSSSADKSRYKRICLGDIGYNTMRMWQGVSALSRLEGIISPAYTVCTPNESMDARFVAYFFKFHPVIHFFWRYSQGMVSDTLNLKYHNFSEIKVVLPERIEQRAIAEVLETADSEIHLHESELAALEKQKRGLMQKLLTGEVRVKVSEGASNRKAFL